MPKQFISKFDASQYKHHAIAAKSSLSSVMQVVIARLLMKTRGTRAVRELRSARGTSGTGILEPTEGIFGLAEWNCLNGAPTECLKGLAAFENPYFTGAGDRI